jgi:hypothetical protein
MKIGHPCNFAEAIVAATSLDVVIGSGAISNGRPVARSTTAVDGSGIKRK